jgi:hypothetical protein
MVESSATGNQRDRTLNPIPQFNDPVCRLACAPGMNNSGQGHYPISAGHSGDEAHQQSLSRGVVSGGPEGGVLSVIRYDAHGLGRVLDD